MKKGGKDCWWCEAVFLMYSKKFSAVCCPEGIFPPFFLQASLLFLTVFPGKQIPLEAKVGGDIGGGGGGQKVAKTKKRGGGAWKKKLDCRKCRLPPSSSSSSSLAVETFLGGFIREREGGKGGGAKSGREKNVSLGDQSLPLLYRFSFPFSKLRILSFQYNITHFPIFFSEKWDSGYHEESESKVSQKMDKGKTTIVEGQWKKILQKISSPLSVLLSTRAFLLSYLPQRREKNHYRKSIPRPPRERERGFFSEKSYFPSLTFNRGQFGEEKKNSTTVETRIFLLQQGGGEP